MNVERFATKRLARWRWEATERLASGAWVVAYGWSHRSARRHLSRMREP